MSSDNLLVEDTTAPLPTVVEEVPTTDNNEPQQEQEDAAAPNNDSYLGAVKRFIPDPARPFTVFQPKSRHTVAAASTPTSANPTGEEGHEEDVCPKQPPSESGTPVLSQLHYAPPPALFHFNGAAQSFPISPSKQQTFDTMSSFTHHETESVVSSWIDDDDYFVSAAMHDVQIVNNQQYAPESNGQQSRRSQRRGGGWKETGPKRNRLDARTPNAKAPAASVSGGRFDALATDKRRW